MNKKTRDMIISVMVILVLGFTIIYGCNGIAILLGLQFGADSIECNWLFCQITFSNMTKDITITKTCLENGLVTPCP